MSVFRDPAEIVEIAIRIERSGVEFYKKLMTSSDSAAARDLFSFLAADEERHLGYFRELLLTVAKYTARYSYPGEFGTFIDEFASMAIKEFTRGDGIPAGNGMDDAIELALDVEKDSILFYTEMRSKFSEDQGAVIDKIIKEEKQHVLELKTFREKHANG
jgi:rubrerythrin